MKTIPILIKRVVCPDVNDHGVYAVLELAKATRNCVKARYVVTPIRDLTSVTRSVMEADL
jgi:hypothetical protein